MSSNVQQQVHKKQVETLNISKTLFPVNQAKYIPDFMEN